jgi:hypothetical protein
MTICLVRPGDKLSGIPKRCGATVAQIRSLKLQLSNPNVIHVMALNLPEEAPPQRANFVDGDAPWHQVARPEPKDRGSEGQAKDLGS